MKSTAKWRILSLFILLGVVVAGGASARVWSKNPIALAQDYVVINDNRGAGEMILVLWLASPLLPDGPASDVARDLLDKNILIGVAHVHVAKDGSMTFDPVPTMDATDGAGGSLKQLDTGAMSPAIVASMTMVQTIFTRSLGQLGQGVHWFVFDAGATRACAPGGLAITVADEKYTYDTPIPGCR